MDSFSLQFSKNINRSELIWFAVYVECWPEHVEYFRRNLYVPKKLVAQSLFFTLFDIFQPIIIRIIKNTFELLAPAAVLVTLTIDFSAKSFQLQM